MSDKTFLQELDNIKRKIEGLREQCWNGTECNCKGLDQDFESIIGDVQRMINQCIEIQLQMMKQENAKNFYKEKDV